MNAAQLVASESPALVAALDLLKRRRPTIAPGVVRLVLVDATALRKIGPGHPVSRLPVCVPLASGGVALALAAEDAVGFVAALPVAAFPTSGAALSTLRRPLDGGLTTLVLCGAELSLVPFTLPEPIEAPAHEAQATDRERTVLMLGERGRFV